MRGKQWGSAGTVIIDERRLSGDVANPHMSRSGRCKYVIVLYISQIITVGNASGVASLDRVERSGRDSTNDSARMGAVGGSEGQI
jgi:hypothetical protein